MYRKNRFYGKLVLFLVLLGMGTLFFKKAVPAANVAATQPLPAISFSKPQPPISLQLEVVSVHEGKSLVRLRFTPFLDASSVEVFVTSGEDGTGEKVVLFKGAASKGIQREVSAEVDTSNKASIIGGVILETLQGSKFTKVVTLPHQESQSSAVNPAPLPKATQGGEKTIEFLV